VSPTSPERDRQRWQGETARAQLKTTRRMDGLHGKTGPGVLQELPVLAIVYHLVRMVMGPSALLQHTGVERICCLAARRWLGAPSTGIPRGALIVNAIRPHRVEPRVKKRRPKSFPLRIKSRQALHQQLLHQEVGGSLHAIRPLATFGEVCETGAFSPLVCLC
jgi:hypothetical protein